MWVFGSVEPPLGATYKTNDGGLSWVDQPRASAARS